MNKVTARTIEHAATNPETTRLTEKGFIENIDAIRKRARQHTEQGAVTGTYKADRNADSAAAEFLEHANEEQADSLANMLVGAGKYQ